MSYNNLQPKTDFRIGEVVNIKWSRLDYNGKSVRRRVMDDIIEYCLSLPVSNLAKYVVSMRYMLDSSSVNKDLKLMKSIIKGKRKSLPKISDEKRDWIRTISESIDNFKEAVIVGMEVCPHHLSTICPAHISYINSRSESHQLIRYQVMVVGIIDKGTEREREVVFKTTLLSDYMEKR